MHIAIFTSGGISNGIWSSVNGEGRWALNLARVLVEQDSSVQIDLINDSVPQWGVQPPMARINMKSVAQINKNFTYDVVIYLPWDLQLPQSKNKNWHTCPDSTAFIKAKLYIHNQFSWTTGLLAYTCYQQNHIIVYPFKQSATTFQGAPDTFKYEFLPYPHGWDYLPADPSRTSIVWPSKEVFHPAFEKRSIHIPQQGINMLEALNTLNSKFKISKIHLLSGHTFNPNWSPLVNKLGVTKLIQQLPQAQIYNWVTYNEIYNIFKDCRVSVPIAGLAASLTESICLGVVPLVYNGLPLEEIAAKNKVLLNSHSCSKQEVSELIELYSRDDIVYKNTIEEYQDFMKDHCAKEVYRYFINIVNKHIGLS